MRKLIALALIAVSFMFAAAMPPPVATNGDGRDPRDPIPGHHPELRGPSLESTIRSLGRDNVHAVMPYEND